MGHPVVILRESGKPESDGVIRFRIMGAAVGIAMGIIWLPTLLWYVERLDDGCAEPLGLLTLLLVAAISWRDRHHAAAGRLERLAGALVLGASAASIGLLPPMIRAALAMTGTGLWFGLGRNPALFGLLFLSLPVGASMHFYLGYPLRLTSAEGAFRLLELGGIVVTRQGTNIDIGAVRVAVDPDCAGVFLLWHAMAAAMALAALHRMSWRAAITTGLLAVMLVIPANTLRVAWLAVEHSGRVPPTGISHDHAGLICFLIPLPALWWRASRTPRPERKASLPQPAGNAAKWTLILTAALTPWMMYRKPSSDINAPPQPLPIGNFPEEPGLRGMFPGMISSHARGGDRVVLRRVVKATRILHPARDCLRGAGFEISPACTLRYPDGSEWTRFTATRHGVRWIVHERIVSEQDGSTWTDVPAWYWSALAYPLNGPWRAETVISR